MLNIDSSIAIVHYRAIRFVEFGFKNYFTGPQKVSTLEYFGPLEEYAMMAQ